MVNIQLMEQRWKLSSTCSWCSEILDHLIGYRYFGGIAKNALFFLFVFFGVCLVLVYAMKGFLGLGNIKSSQRCLKQLV
jgi:hypothetical protein